MGESAASFDGYITERSAPVRKVLEELRALVHEALPEAAEGFKWGAPVFDNAHGVTVVYLYGGKDHANLGFVRGAELNDPDKLLKGSGKAGRHVQVFPSDETPKAALAALLRQCADTT
jgi:hypothetical protein